MGEDRVRQPIVAAKPLPHSEPREAHSFAYRRSREEPAIELFGKEKGTPIPDGPIGADKGPRTGFDENSRHSPHALERAGAAPAVTGVEKDQGP